MTSSQSSDTRFRHSPLAAIAGCDSEARGSSSRIREERGLAYSIYSELSPFIRVYVIEKDVTHPHGTNKVRNGCLYGVFRVRIALLRTVRT
jgi:hypothetical protein